MKKPELISPVQDFVSLKTAIDAGCDAVYFGLKEFSMRAGAKNFSLAELREVVKICHKNKVKAYLTLNTIIYENELDRIKEILKKVKKAKVDAIHAWDFSVILEAKKLKIPVHISTQASVSNSKSARFFKKLGVKRIILARECSLPKIKQIIKKTGLEIETFIHGAMCVSISGRCFLSQEIFGKSANRGECLQPCRRKYHLKDVEEDHEFEIGQDHIISPKDLCTIEFIDRLIEAGISAFKIEGRNRSPEYVKVTTECYRKAIDACFNKKFNKNLAKKLKNKLKTVYNRGFSSGFFLGKPINEWTKAYGSKAIKKKEFIGLVKNYFKKPKVLELKVQRRGLKLGETLMIQGPTTGVVSEKISSIFNEKDKKVNLIKKGNSCTVKFKKLARKNDKVYVVEKT